ncbi:MAG: hypothetical protein JJE18_07710 [Eubacteriaceae bacterium]|nr:hypothetical protein [Eubacteriaceae bacterium]
MGAVIEFICNRHQLSSISILMKSKSKFNHHFAPHDKISRRY